MGCGTNLRTLAPRTLRFVPQPIRSRSAPFSHMIKDPTNKERVFHLLSPSPHSTLPPAMEQNPSDTPAEEPTVDTDTEVLPLNGIASDQIEQVVVNALNELVSDGDINSIAG